MRKAVQKLIDDLATDPQMRARAEAIKAELLANPLLAEQAKTLWAEIESGLNSALPANSEAIAHTCEQGLRSIGAWLVEDEERKASLNASVLAVTQQFAAALPVRDRRLYRAGRPRLGYRDPGRPARAAGRQGSAIHPHQRHAGRRAGRATDLHRVEVAGASLRGRPSPARTIKNRSRDAFTLARPGKGAAGVVELPYRVALPNFPRPGRRWRLSGGVDHSRLCHGAARTGDPARRRL